MVVYTSVIGFVIVHVLKITKGVENNNEDVLQTNKKLEEKLERLVFRMEELEEKISRNTSAMAYVNIISREQLNRVRNTKGKRNDEINTGLKKHTKVENHIGGRQVRIDAFYVYFLSFISETVVDLGENHK